MERAFPYLSRPPCNSADVINIGCCAGGRGLVSTDVNAPPLKDGRARGVHMYSRNACMFPTCLTTKLLRHLLICPCAHPCNPPTPPPPPPHPTPPHPSSLTHLRIPPMQSQLIFHSLQKRLQPALEPLLAGGGTALDGLPIHLSKGCEENGILGNEVLERRPAGRKQCYVCAPSML